MMKQLVSTLIVLVTLLSRVQADLYDLCYTVQSNSSSPFHPWSVALQGIVNTTGAPFIPTLIRVPVNRGGNRTARLAGNFIGTRTQIDQFGVTTTINITTCAPGQSQLGEDQYLYETAPFLDYNGMCLTVTNASTSAFVILANNQPTDYLLLYTNLPDSAYVREYHSDWPVNAQMSVTKHNSSLPAPQCTPPTIVDPNPPTLKWQFCYQAYAAGWQVAMSGVITTLAASTNLTSPNPTWRIVSVAADRVQNVSGVITTQQIVGQGFSNSIDSPSSLSSSDALLFAQAPHVSSNGLAFVSSSFFAFPNGVIPSETQMKIPMIKIRALNNQSATESNGPAPVWSQFAVSRLADGYNCPIVTVSNSSSIATDSVLSPDEPPAPTPDTPPNDAATLSSVTLMTFTSLFVFFILL